MHILPVLLTMTIEMSGYFHISPRERSPGVYEIGSRMDPEPILDISKEPPVGRRYRDALSDSLITMPTELSRLFNHYEHLCIQYMNTHIYIYILENNEMGWACGAYG